MWLLYDFVQQERDHLTKPLNMVLPFKSTYNVPTLYFLLVDSRINIFVVCEVLVLTSIWANRCASTHQLSFASRCFTTLSLVHSSWKQRWEQKQHLVALLCLRWWKNKKISISVHNNGDGGGLKEDTKKGQDIFYGTFVEILYTAMEMIYPPRTRTD